MAQVIDLDGLPDPVAKAIMETVVNLKNRYTAKNAGSPATSSQKLSAQEADAALDEVLASLPPMPSLSDKALSRESIYAPEDEAR
jgi:hypothetical protein